MDSKTRMILGKERGVRVGDGDRRGEGRQIQRRSKQEKESVSLFECVINLTFHERYRFLLCSVLLNNNEKDYLFQGYSCMGWKKEAQEMIPRTKE